MTTKAEHDFWVHEWMHANTPDRDAAHSQLLHEAELIQAEHQIRSLKSQDEKICRLNRGAQP